MRELDVVGVRVEMPSNAPMVLLREVGGTRYLPIWIGAAEAAAIANAQEGIVPPRPLTHDLMVDTLTTLGHRLTEVHITELEGGTFYAVLLVDGIEVSARPRMPSLSRFGSARTSIAPRTCSMRPASRSQKPRMTR
jgi:bifunctional DNase/RNase